MVLYAFTKHTTQKIYKKATIYVNELILTLFSPFDIKWVKNFWKYILRESRRMNFPYLLQIIGFTPNTF